MRHTLASRGAACGATGRVGAPDAIERQIREKLLELRGGVRLERGLHAPLVLVEFQDSPARALGPSRAAVFCRSWSPARAMVSCVSISRPSLGNARM